MQVGASALEGTFQFTPVKNEAERVPERNLVLPTVLTSATFPCADAHQLPTGRGCYPVGGCWRLFYTTFSRVTRKA